MGKKQNSPNLKTARQEIYDFFEKEGYVFKPGAKAYLSEAIKNYAKKHNEIIISQMNYFQDALERNKKRK